MATSINPWLPACPQAYSFLERRREAATASCDWGQPDSCTDLEKLNDMAHELLATGSVSGWEAHMRP